MTILLAKLIWICGVISWYLIRYPFARRSRKTKIVRRDYKVREAILLTISAAGLGFLPALYMFTPVLKVANYPIQIWQPWMGAIIFGLALYMFRQTHRALDRYWSVTLEVKERHILMTDGVYKRVRHPMYAAFWLWALAQAVLIPNAIAGLAGLVGFGTLYFLRVRKEEALMIETFGDEYKLYMQRTHRVIPHVY
ncbi:protein-S-isoprenylcysteine O-methyltransferase [Rhodoplanes sp. Z2-YC6860]|uniref:protein-S-isoprenylcysteine O-methyltransferase n=1 Tax=Rhodoplanes sp. Z2-YC6860 TaxID=674703 RepID=UPI00078CD676|nr:protein-S-isoprenylcysteine O-methyltransferase [Rhodoplanes sp. Z2-YC6860]AMN44107.1 isoprenylcysteine carboxyl methyltransferase [Rhodoplanes sp. Z2-YC6860]